MSSADVSPCTTPSGTPLSGNHAPKFGTVIPNRIFVGGIAANTTEAELKQFFTAYGAVKDTKIIADRAGVSKGYGFVTFENQEDAERIIKKEADNLVFKDRKLNIGPAIRKQVLPRTYDPNLTQGTVMFTNGVPYTYQNGMAVFHSPDGGYQIPQAQGLQCRPTHVTAAQREQVKAFREGWNDQHHCTQPAYTATVMVPQTPTMYHVAPQYSAYQPVSGYEGANNTRLLASKPMPQIKETYTHLQATPQWTTAAAAAAANQWRWAPQSPGQPALTANPAYVYATMHTAPELMYATQPPPQAYGTELADAALMEGAPVEGTGVVPVQPPLANHMHVTDANSLASSEQTPVTTVLPMHTPASNTATTVANLKRNVAITRRSYSSPTILVKHGHKVQRVMLSPGSVYGGASDTGEHCHEGIMKAPHLNPSSN
ncbi:RNA-binding protein Musashi homolog 2-like isoform X2 [Haliotis rufescens]|uniref:RNA-binding protein Musashi homolog 2-like isoform X2 n=1 Tax=Haliotis rufescens TaxID=6454 RepID=UPI00201F736D|nr:RNA-binding protein Musashi homolog 2-like isoform X2 [Haliotis rufescens]